MRYFFRVNKHAIASFFLFITNKNEKCRLYRSSEFPSATIEGSDKNCTCRRKVATVIEQLQWNGNGMHLNYKIANLDKIYFE